MKNSIHTDQEEIEIGDTENLVETRRKTLKAILASGAVAGVALPDSWKKPLVDAVILPAHAQASPEEEEESSSDSPKAKQSWNIAARKNADTGTLRAFGMGTLNAACVQKAGDPPPDEYTDFMVSWFKGSTLLDTDTQAPQDCTQAVALVSGCVLSVSLALTTSDVDVGDQITMRAVYGGSCVSTVVVTVGSA